MILSTLKYSDTKLKKFIYLLRNKDYVQKFSINKNKFSLTKHDYWLKKFFQKKRNKIHIIFNKEKPTGYIRIEEYRKNSFNVSWALLKKYHRKKIMSKYLKIKTRNHNNKFKAVILKNNFASIKTAINAGFKIKKKTKENYCLYK